MRTWGSAGSFLGMHMAQHIHVHGLLAPHSTSKPSHSPALPFIFLARLLFDPTGITASGNYSVKDLQVIILDRVLGIELSPQSSL